MTLKFGMQHRVLKYYLVCSNDDPGLILTDFTAGSNLVLYAFVYGKKLKQCFFFFFFFFFFSEAIVFYNIKVGR